MNDVGDPGTPSCLKQLVGVGDSVGERCRAPLESDPIRVVERGDPLKAALERSLVIEAIRQGLDPGLKRMLAIRVMGQGSHLSPGVDQELRDTRA